MTVPALRPATAVEKQEQEQAVSQAPRRWRPTISAVLTLSFVLLIVLAVGAVMLVSFKAARENTFELLRDTSELVVGSVIGQIGQHLDAAQYQVEHIAELIVSGELDETDRDQLEQILLGSLAATPQVSGIAFVDGDFEATRVGRQHGEPFKLRSNWGDLPEIRAWIGQMRQTTGSGWSEILWIEDLRTPSITMQIPVYRDGNYVGVIASVVSVGSLSEFVTANDEAYNTHSFILYGRDRVLAHPSLVGGTRGLSKEKPLPNLGEVNDRILAAIWQESLDDMRNFLGDSQVRGRVVQGPEDEYIYLYSRIEGYGPEPWYVGVYYLANDVNAPFVRLFGSLAIAFAILLAAVVLAVVLGRGIARPIKRLAAASLAVRGFDLSNVQPLQGSPFRELDNAAQAYDAMLAGLRWFETYVPKSLVLRLMRLDAAAAQSEERSVSVLFTDIVGFTGLSDRLPAADLAGFLNQHFALLGDAIEVEQGTVDKYIGDSVMAFWGAPTDQPGHATQACRTAIAIARNIEADNRQRREAGLDAIRLRIGVHSGPALVGNIGAPGRVNYTLVGDTVNIAQRLEGLGKEFPLGDDQTIILVSGETAAALEPGFMLSPLGRHQLRGRARSTEVFRLTGYEKPATALPEGAPPT